MKKIALVLSLVLLSFTAVRVSPVFAQEEGAIRQQEVTAEEQERLRQEYRQVIESYRNQERQYQISVQQYDQLQTLKALEKAVQDTRQVMITRDDLLIRYLQLLRLQLSDTHGAPLDQKAVVLSTLEQQELALKAHQQQVTAVTTRPELAQVVSSFLILGKDVQTVVYQALQLIAFGKVQNVFDKTQALMPVVQEKLPERNTGALLAEKQRGMEEIERNLEEVRSSLITTRDQMVKQLPNSNDSAHTNLLKSIETPYLGLVKALNYIEEVMR